MGAPGPERCTPRQRGACPCGSTDCEAHSNTAVPLRPAPVTDGCSGQTLRTVVSGNAINPQVCEDGAPKDQGAAWTRLVSGFSSFPGDTSTLDTGRLGEVARQGDIQPRAAGELRGRSFRRVLAGSRRLVEAERTLLLEPGHKAERAPPARPPRRPPAPGHSSLRWAGRAGPAPPSAEYQLTQPGQPPVVPLGDFSAAFPGPPGPDGRLSGL